jgi:hypothetical protein
MKREQAEKLVKAALDQVKADPEDSFQQAQD